jgi:hypothetical protein
LHSLASNIFTAVNISSLVPNTLYLLYSFFIMKANSVPLVSIISCKTGGCCYCCCCCCCCYAFACDLFCGDDCDENLVFDSVKGCGELVCVVGGEELGEEESEFSKNSIEGFFLLVELGELWFGVFYDHTT